MLTIYQLKPRFQALLRPLAARLVGWGLTANAVTVAALMLGLVGGGALLLAPGQRWPLLCMPAVLFLRMALNALDGMMAREHHQSSRLGTLLNELGDGLGDAVLYLPFGLVPGLPPLLLASVVLLGVISELAGVLGMALCGTRRYDGPLGKSDRAFAFGVLALLLGLGLSPGAWSLVLLGLLNLLAAATIVTRSRAILQQP